jgi:hypothetical protein
MWNISGMRERAPLVFFSPPSYIITELNKPYIIKNGGELSNVEYLPTKPENAEYLWNARTRASRLFCPLKLHNTEFKQALDHKKRWRIELPRLPAPQTENAQYL